MFPVPRVDSSNYSYLMDVQVGDIDNLDLVKNQIVSTMKAKRYRHGMITGEKDNEASFLFGLDF